MNTIKKTVTMTMPMNSLFYETWIRAHEQQLHDFKSLNSNYNSIDVKIAEEALVLINHF